MLQYTGPFGPQVVQLGSAGASVGRQEGQDVILPELFVSRQHAAIVREGAGFCVVDKKSTSGTFLNGKRIERAALRPGDVLQFGSIEATRVCFEVERRVVTETPAAGTSTVLLESFQNVEDFERLNWLLNGVRQLNTGGAVEEILAALLQLTLQLTGVERGFVFLREDGGMRLTVGRNAAGEDVGEDGTLSRRAMDQATATAGKFFITDTLADQGSGGWQSVVLNNIRSIYCLPLRRRNPTGREDDLLGLLYLDSRTRAGQMNSVDHRLLDTIATEAAGLLENAVLAEAEEASREAHRELAIAAKIHNGLMANKLPTVPYASVCAVSRPCKEIGGDFYDAIALPDCLCVTIADVSGKGVSAAIVAATIQGIIYSQAVAGRELAEIASLLNTFLYQREVGKYATLVMLKVFPDGTMEYLNCGHIAPLAALEGKATELAHGNLIVGLVPEATYCSAKYKLSPGEKVILVTDGVTESENGEGIAYGEQHLMVAACTLKLDEILAHMGEFTGGAAASDDCTLLESATRVRGEVP